MRRRRASLEQAVASPAPAGRDEAPARKGQVGPPVESRVVLAVEGRVVPAVEGQVVLAVAARVVRVAQVVPESRRRRPSRGSLAPPNAAGGCGCRASNYQASRV